MFSVMRDALATLAVTGTFLGTWTLDCNVVCADGRWVCLFVIRFHMIINLFCNIT